MAHLEEVASLAVDFGRYMAAGGMLCPSPRMCIAARGGEPGEQNSLGRDNCSLACSLPRLAETRRANKKCGDASYVRQPVVSPGARR